MSRIQAPKSPADKRYHAVMSRIRERFDTIERLNQPLTSMSDAETIGAHLRKIIEGIAFGCVIATEHSVKSIPRKAAGHWNAENIFLALKKSGEFPYPDPNDLRHPTDDELKAYPQVTSVLEGVVSSRISVDELREIYRRTHAWNHEDNPYIIRPLDEKNFGVLKADVKRVYDMLRLHRIGIQGRSFICTIKDEQDGEVKVAAAEKVQGL